MKIIIDERGKKYIVNGESDFHSDLGILKKDSIKNASIGDTLTTHLDKEFKVIKANVNDFIDLMTRRCSILIQKDIGVVISHTGIGYGSRIVDAGTGAGAIALNFGNIIGDTGKVYTYEIREDFAKIATENIANFGLNNIEVKNKDIKEGIDEKELDLIFLDLPQPYDIFENCYTALNLGGWIAIYAPYIDQIQTSYRIAKKIGFTSISIIETLEREIEVRNQGTRPKTRMVGHSGYLLFARKL
ncbi:tRNA (adenine-N1)-methyltransferase [Methanobrevibacter filiformis]|uniref:tRNA (Adenine(58)-N(1))-methyltransferase TrmI n=1 Tax=Methanobrevibacter filiformis TaxID=55758 RepID=A0A166AYC4_9EURY|nr:tRNA (adenine-N1)-methyltransferase [Methanobrevibacter filiformis]KZX12628.1 tRNA (adenine(58)-N(1))-methyltransferase TrmI [Methanobrevibacter filiformis]